MHSEPLSLNGAIIWKNHISPSDQGEMVDALRGIAQEAPFRQFETPGGHKMSVRMSGAGERSWVADRNGYRYDLAQLNGAAWPEIPECMFAVWRDVAGVSRLPDTCLINYYGEGARMGLHQDRDEANLEWPVVSISLGDAALFRVGGRDRRDPTKSLWLNSGDVAVLAGSARLAFHGVDRIKFGSSALLPKSGRINVTLRVAG